MLEKEFVPYEPSLELKELGFDEPHFKSYVGISNNGDIKDCTYVLCNGKLNNDDVSAPTFSQAFRFFREKYGLRNSITDFIDDETGIEWDYEIAIIGTDLDEKGNYEPLVDYSVDDETRKFKTYEEAELGCLIKLIEIVKNK